MRLKILGGRRWRFLLSRASSLSLIAADIELELLAFRNVFRVIAETVEELSFHHRLGPVFLLLLAELLELESLKIHLLETLHARVLDRTLESALRYL